MPDNLDPEAQKQLAELMVGMSKNPKTRKEFTRLVREVNPSMSFPDVEKEEMRETITSEFAKRDQENETKRVKERLEAQRSSLITSGRFKEEDVGKIEKEVMEKHGISDYEVAAKVYAADMRPASPTPEIKSRVWEMPMASLGKEALGNMDNFARNEAYKAIDDIKKKRPA